MDIPRVLAKELYPFHAEEWINMFVGLADGINNYLLLSERTCKVMVFDAAISALALRNDYDSAYPMQVFPIIMKAFGYIMVVMKIYNGVMACIEERVYFEIKEMWEEADIEAEEEEVAEILPVEEETFEDFLLAEPKKRDDAEWETVTHPEYDQRFN